MENLKCKVMFDNGGGVHVDFAGYKHTYADGKSAAQDYKIFVNDGNTDSWDGHNEDLEIKDGRCPNGGYKTVNYDQIQALINNSSNNFWGRNEREFIEELTK